MGKKRRRSEASDTDGDSGSSLPVQKKQRIDNWNFPVELNRKVELCHKLYDFLRKYKDADNRTVCDFLVRAPSRRLLPHYYEVVSSPIDLMKIQQKLKTEGYPSVRAFLSDVQLLLDNARSFYQRSSEEWQGATTLERAFLSKLGEMTGRKGEASVEAKPAASPSLTLRISKDQLVAARPGTRTTSAQGNKQSGTKGASSFGTKPTASPGGKAASGFGTKPTASPGGKAASGFGTKPTASPGGKAASGFGTKPTASLGGKAASGFGTKPTASPGGKAASGFGTKPTASPGGKAASGFGTKPTASPGGKAASGHGTKSVGSLGTKAVSDFGTKPVPSHGTKSTATAATQVHVASVQERSHKLPKSKVVAPPTSEATSLSRPATQKGGPPVTKTATSAHTTPTPSLAAPKTGQPSHATPKSQPKAGPSGSSIKPVTLRVKVTRSKAWLQQFASSDDPVKMYLAAVYDYHEPNGEFVAETFHELPSAKYYPEYYRVITEPIDLNTIKTNVEDGRYANLKEIQDDLLLMIKNAHYFNEPSSEVYKNATALRKVIVNKCLELERKFQTVSKTQPLKVSIKRPSSSDGGVAPGTSSGDTPSARPKGKVGGAGEEGQDKSSAESESEASDSESGSSEEELSSEGEGEGEGPRAKLILHVKKERLAASRAGVDPVTKLLRARKLPPLKKRLMAVYRSLVTKTDSDGRVISELFMKKPTVKAYPEYYMFIKQPIDLREIRGNIKTEYSNLDELMAAVNLMVDNACTFNEEGSQVYNDALTLRQVAQDAIKRLRNAWLGPKKPRRVHGSILFQPPLLGTGTTGGGVGEGGGEKEEAEGGEAANKEMTPVRALFEAVKGCMIPKGRYLWMTFRQLPPQALATNYYSVIKQPIDMQTIAAKVQRDQYDHPDQLLADYNLLCDNACSYYSKTSNQYRDAVLLFRVAVEKHLQLTEKERKARVVPNAKESVRKLLQEIVTETLSLEDEFGRRLSDNLGSVTIVQHLPSEDTHVKRTLTLAKLTQWLAEGRYCRLDKLQSDLLALLHRAREGRGTQSQVYKDSVTLARRYLEVRDEVCQKGDRLWSPALKFTRRSFDLELAARPSLKSPLPAPPSLSSRRSHDRESTPASSTTTRKSSIAESYEEEEMDEEDLPDGSSSECVQQVEQEGQKYRVGDIVYVTSRKSEKKPHIVLIEKFWKDGSGTVWLNGCWFYRPEETYHLASRKFYEKEVFKSDFHGLARVSEIQGACHVMFIKDYIKALPEGFAEDDVYLCESRYSYKPKVIKKIKILNWKAGHEVGLIPRAAPLVLKREVPSIFARGMQDEMTEEPHMAEDGMETENVDLEPDMEDSRDDDVEEMDDDASVDVLETSFCENLENVSTSVATPEAGCSYYEQYCIDENRFRLGDYVYVRSDQERAFIARIERMWTDANSDPWFHGPWFIRPEETEHRPTRMFLERELFQSNIEDTNPMRSIMGKCAVLFVTDYCKKRPTEEEEEDVFVAESCYNEGDKEIRKMTELKSFPPSKSVPQDEIYYFPEEITPLKLASPNLFPKEGVPDYLPPLPPPLGPQLETFGPQSEAPLPADSKSSSPSWLNLSPQLLQNPQLLQSLLSSVQQMSSSKPVIIPLQQPPLSTQPGTTPTTTPIPTYKCGWDECGHVFSSVSDLSNHVLFGLESHVSKEAQGDGREGNFYCRWNPCPRNPKLGGKPFDLFTKLTRHLKEVHIMKLSQGILGLNPRHTPTPSSVSLKHFLQTVTTPPSTTPTTSATPLTPVTTVTRVIPAAAVSSMLSSSSQPASSTTTTTATPTAVSKPLVVTAGESKSTAIDESEVADIFHPPPEDRRKLVHSEIYLRYINSLKSGSPHLNSRLSAQSIQANKLMNPPKPIRASDWLSSEAVQERDVVEALLSLRERMLWDSVKLARHLESNQ